MKHNMAHYWSSVRKPGLHRVLCRCRGHGFRYHILQFGR